MQSTPYVHGDYHTVTPRSTANAARACRAEVRSAPPAHAFGFEQRLRATFERLRNPLLAGTIVGDQRLDLPAQFSVTLADTIEETNSPDWAQILGIPGRDSEYAPSLRSWPYQQPA